MKELSKEERFNEFIRLFTRKEAYRRIEEMFKPKVTRKWLNKQVDYLITYANKYEWQEFYSHIEDMLVKAGVKVEK